MNALGRIAFIGNSLPRRCGIATFTTDLQQTVATTAPGVETSIVAMTDHGHSYDYPSSVRIELNDDRLENYIDAAGILNAGNVDVVSLQHEFGIFGGDAGGHVLALVSRLTMPVVTTLHTVLANPTAIQRRVLGSIIAASSKVVVMAEKGRELLRTVYRLPQDKIEVIPHGVPDVPFVEPGQAKAEFGLVGRTVILTFGLLSPDKGIEVVVDAMPGIVRRCPNAVYVVLGATHPNLVLEQGEAYRKSLMARARDLGVQDHVVFVDQFVDVATLLGFIAMCDVYVTPYLKEAQMTSGTLAYSFGMGRAVVSTPYWHAQELLAHGRGVLVPFGDPTATGDAIATLLTDDRQRQAMRERAYSIGRSMTWERTAQRYLATFEGAWRRGRLRVVARHDQVALLLKNPPLPQMQLCHFLSMCDDTGLFQHAVHSVPNRAHGYCVDDNARALLVACALNGPGEQRLSEDVTARFAAFIQHAWNPDILRFRNFMSFDRRWLEDHGSEDSHGRALWALGECARADASPSRRRWAAALFIEALPAVADFTSPRAWAFTLLGLDAYCAAAAGDCAGPARGFVDEPADELEPSAFAGSIRHRLADRLMALLSAVETEDWPWFEEGLAYDNARLPQALIVTGAALGAPAMVAAGLRSLRWLMTLQTAPSGVFRPVGTQSFGDRRARPLAFDQQPLEATATIAACLAAAQVDDDLAWQAEARRVFAWFVGGNDLGLSLVDQEIGSCRDGLHPGHLNENRGGESVVSYLLGLAEIRQLACADTGRVELAPLHAFAE